VALLCTLSNWVWVTACETALLRIHSDLITAADAGKISLIAMPDLSSALNGMDHDILLQRMSRDFGLAQPIIYWLRSYLTRRSQVVKCHKLFSSIRMVHSGVPQGSVLCLLLLLLYTSELLGVIEEHGLNGHGYADDTQLYSSCRSLDIPILRSNILHCIDAISNWTASNRLRLNPDKTEFMWCATSMMQHHCDMSPFVLGDVQFDPQSKVHLLVVILDRDLSMSFQIN